jgi:polysaccharide deacetylase family protein (PEP-CTERM system associated)
MNSAMTLDDSNIKNCFSVDVEDWFHGYLPMAQWHKYTSRLDRGLNVVLDLLAKNNTKGTFFILGCLVAEYPNLIKKIADAGHEIGSHTYTHEFVYKQTPDVFRAELRKTKSVLEQLTGRPCIAHRSPYFSITSRCLWALDVLAEEGFTDDSSIISVTTWLYGLANCPDYIFKLKETGLRQFPVSPLKLFGKKIGIGGAYFRMLPLGVTANAMAQREAAGQVSMFYIHPWEYDPGHPRVVVKDKMVSLGHYIKLNQTEAYTAGLLKRFRFTTMANVIRQAESEGNIPEIATSFFEQPSCG